MRSNLRSIQLVGIVGAQLLRNRGIDAFLQPFLDDVKKLENGVQLNVRNSSRLWHLILINYAGDMPASNYVAGFKESGSAFSPCRVCSITKTDMENIHYEKESLVREKESYEKQVEELMDENLSPANKRSLSLRYGINRRCCLSALRYFDPTKCFPQDLMHLMHEGIMNLELRLLLENLLDAGLIDIDTINYKISRLKFPREFTIPPPILLHEIKEKKSKLSFSASEMASLCIALPLVLREFVSEVDNVHYANFLLLLKINSSLQCYSFTESQIRTLESDIYFHNSSFVCLYGSVDKNVVTPKLHALTHFPNLIRQFGPPRYYWCYRYESKNAPLKKVMRRNCNFLNVPFSLASQHQKLVGLDVRVDGEGFYFSTCLNELKICSTSRVGVAQNVRNSQWAPLLLSGDALDENDSVIEIKVAKVCGRICRPHTIFLKEMPSSTSLPLFFQISQILLSDNRDILILEDLETLFFSSDSFSYVVKPSKKILFCQLISLFSMSLCLLVLLTRTFM